MVASDVAWVEWHAALAGAARQHRSDRPLGSVVARARRLFEETERVRPDNALVRRAGALAEEHALRGYDAFHLATALETRGATVVTWDGDLAAAALAEGRAVVPALSRP